LRNLEVYHGHTEFMMAKEQLRQDLFRLGQRPQPLKGDAIRCRQCDFDRTIFFALMPFFFASANRRQTELYLPSTEAQNATNANGLFSNTPIDSNDTPPGNNQQVAALSPSSNRPQQKQ
jgi:hypothetical protein